MDIGSSLCSWVFQLQRKFTLSVSCIENAAAGQCMSEINIGRLEEK